MLDSQIIQKYKAHPNFTEIKKCNTCGEYKSYTEFYIHARDTKAGYRLDYECAVCKKTKSRQVKWKNKFGVTEQEVFAMYEKQDGKCSICKVALSLPEFGTGKKSMTVMHIDHNHVTGKVRGLLCHGCNAGLGQFQDKKNLLLAAYKYLEKFDA